MSKKIPLLSFELVSIVQVLALAAKKYRSTFYIDQHSMAPS
jgi:hypothetical protein